jgi:hypothetical protein
MWNKKEEKWILPSFCKLHQQLTQKKKQQFFFSAATEKTSVASAFWKCKKKTITNVGISFREKF